MTADPIRPPTRLGMLLVSEESVYGLILVAGLIVVSTSTVDETWEALVAVVTTVIVFFAAHVYAGTVSRLASHPQRSLGAAMRAALSHSSGLILVAVIPLVFLLLGVIGVLPDDVAVWLALATDVVLLGAVGWLMETRRAVTGWGRVLGTAVAAAFGAVLIILKVLIHH